MPKVDLSKKQHPPAPPDFENDSSREVFFYKPEFNPIMRMVAAERVAQPHVQELLAFFDQFQLETPPVSEDEGASVTSADKRKSGEPPVVEGIAFDDSIITKNLFDYIEEEKQKKQVQKSDRKKKKKKDSKYDKEEKLKKQHKSSEAKSKVASVQRKSRKSSGEESPIAYNRPRSASPSGSPDLELQDGRRHGRKSPSRRSPTHRHRRHKYSSPQYSPTHRSPSPSSRHHRSPGHRSPSPSSRHRRSSGHRSRDTSLSHRLSSRRSPSRGSSYRRSPSYSPDDRSYRHRSPSGSSTRPKSGNRPRSEFSKRYGSVSPDRIRVRKSPTRDRISESYGGPSGSSRRSPEEEDLPVRELEKGGSSKSRKTAAPKPEIRRLPGTGKFKKFPVEDEYSQLLAEEMKKRQLMDDSEEEATVIGEKPAAGGVPLKKEASDDVETTPLSEEQQNLLDYELGIVNPGQMEQDFPQSKFFKKEEIKSEFPDRKKCLLNSYYCQVCQLGLNSELTWQSHISGKKHAKMLKLQTVHEIAKGSISVPSTPAVVSEDIPRFADAAAGKKRYPISAEARLQPAIIDVRDRPLPGLDYIQEIISEMDVNYYCELCDAPCGPSSIMPHLIGYKHQLRCLKRINPDCYERNKDQVKKRFEGELIARLLAHEKKYGRGKIKVFEEIDDPHTRPAYDCPGPSWRNTSSIPNIKREKKDAGDTDIPNNDDCLDTSKGDFFCKLCDSHMNNVNMWEAHVRGKRHLKNAKKIPGENMSKVRSVKAPGARSKLDDLIDQNAKDQLIVGLDYIRETQGLNGEIYNCFLCGSCSTNFDIIEHLLLAKHRLRYLEKLVTEGIPNDVTTISQMEFKESWFRESLVDNECYRLVEIYGRGKVEVYKSKN